MGKKRSLFGKKEKVEDSNAFENLNFEEELKNIPEEDLIYDGNESSISGSVFINKDQDSWSNITDRDEKNPYSKSLKVIEQDEKAQEERLKAILTNSGKDIEKQPLNLKYQRTRRYDNTGEYRIGPSFITRTRLSYLDETKPAKLSVEPDNMKSIEFGLLIYFWKFVDHHDKQEIDLEFLQSLIDSGCDINCKDEHGQTILHAIVRDWHPDVALFAIHNNIDVNAQDKYGRTPLHLAAALNSEKMAKVLLQNGAEIEILTANEKQSPTHYAAKYNSVETLALLLRYHGNFSLKDSEGKTALFLAAENGSSDTAQLLLDLEAPVGVFDNEGISCISHLIEKMHNVAYQALNQFIVTKSRRNEIYLGYLENNPNSKKVQLTRGPLEIITVYDEYNLIMHPVIQKLLKVKWEKFGRFIALRQLFVLFIYLSCWMVLAYLFDDSGIYYLPLKKNGWKIILEVIIIFSAAFFFYEDLSRTRETINIQTAWIERRRHTLRSKYSFCHPAWPNDRHNIEVEIERIQGAPNVAWKQKFWFVYEFIMLLIIAAIIATRIIDAKVKNEASFLAHKCMFAIGLMGSFLRVLKICLQFRFFSAYLIVTGLAITAFIQIAFFYLQFYIPFVAVFWVTFGLKESDPSNALNVSANLNGTTPLNGTVALNSTVFDDLKTLDGIFYHVYESSFGQEDLFELTNYDKYAAQTLISLYHIFTTFISLTILVALITSVFTTSYKKCVAEASILQATMLLQFEKKLSKTQRKEMAAYYALECTPLIVTGELNIDRNFLQNVTLKLGATERYLNDINDTIREAERKKNNENIGAQTNILENIFTNLSVLKEKQGEIERASKIALKELVDKEAHLNRCLSKLIKLQT